MSKIKLLLDVVNDMRSLADSIQAVCEAMVDSDSDPKETPTTKTEKANEPDISLEKVRMVLAEKVSLALPLKCGPSLGSMVLTS